MKFSPILVNGITMCDNCHEQPAIEQDSSKWMGGVYYEQYCKECSVKEQESDILLAKMDDQWDAEMRGGEFD